MFDSDGDTVYECFFYCKQKTAYEMRISDWGSCVCSSDLVESFKVTFCPLTSCAVAVFGAPAPTTANAASATVATRMLFVLLMQIPPCPCSKALTQSYCDCSLGSAGSVRPALAPMGANDSLVDHRHQRRFGRVWLSGFLPQGAFRGNRSAG